VKGIDCQRATAHLSFLLAIRTSGGCVGSDLVSEAADHYRQSTRHLNVVCVMMDRTLAPLPTGLRPTIIVRQLVSRSSERGSS
jgi:hypothetical protein